MGKLVIHHNLVTPEKAQGLVSVCPFDAISYENDNQLMWSHYASSYSGNILLSGKMSINDFHAIHDTAKNILEMVEKHKGYPWYSACDESD